MADTTPLPIAVLISGRGTTLKNLLAKIDEGKLPVRIALVISSSPTARGLEFAAAAGIPTQIHERKDHDSPEAYSQAVYPHIRAAGAQLVVMGGFLKLLPVPEDFEGRVINIHPSLIPAYCGKGFFGHHVHEAVLAAGEVKSGCTVHFVDNHYDHGPIILQREVSVEPNDTPDTLAARVFQQECEALPEAIRLFAAGRLKIEDGSVKILPAD